MKNNQEILLDPANFPFQEQSEDNLLSPFVEHGIMAKYTMTAKPIKFLELHYKMIQFLVMKYIEGNTSLLVKTLKGGVGYVHSFSSLSVLFEHFR